MQIQLRDINLKSEAAVHFKCLAVIIIPRMIHEKMGLHSHSVHKSFFLKGLEDIGNDKIPFPFKGSLIIVIEKIHAFRSVFSGKFECLDHKIVSDCFSPE